MDSQIPAWISDEDKCFLGRTTLSCDTEPHALVLLSKREVMRLWESGRGRDIHGAPLLAYDGRLILRPPDTRQSSFGPFARLAAAAVMGGVGRSEALRMEDIPIRTLQRGTSNKIAQLAQKIGYKKTGDTKEIPFPPNAVATLLDERHFHGDWNTPWELEYQAVFLTGWEWTSKIGIAGSIGHWASDAFMALLSEGLAALYPILATPLKTIRVVGLSSLSLRTIPAFAGVAIPASLFDSIEKTFRTDVKLDVSGSTQCFQALHKLIAENSDDQVMVLIKKANRHALTTSRTCVLIWDPPHQQAMTKKFKDLGGNTEELRQVYANHLADGVPTMMKTARDFVHELRSGSPNSATVADVRKNFEWKDGETEFSRLCLLYNRMWNIHEALKQETENYRTFWDPRLSMAVPGVHIPEPILRLFLYSSDSIPKTIGAFLLGAGALWNYHYMAIIVAYFNMKKQKGEVEQGISDTVKPLENWITWVYKNNFVNCDRKKELDLYTYEGMINVSAMELKFAQSKKFYIPRLAGLPPVQKFIEEVWQRVKEREGNASTQTFAELLADAKRKCSRAMKNIEATVRHKADEAFIMKALEVCRNLREKMKGDQWGQWSQLPLEQAAKYALDGYEDLTHMDVLLGQISELLSGEVSVMGNAKRLFDEVTESYEKTLKIHQIQKKKWVDRLTKLGSRGLAQTPGLGSDARAGASRGLLRRGDW